MPHKAAKVKSPGLTAIVAQAGRHADRREAHARALEERGQALVGCARGGAGNAAGDLRLSMANS